ncbi:MAG: NDP-hexose 2,3-dehydratase family protein [Candidatus Margulisbacteria bacterium]|nr:NDP-hexose 2,3-dehydratase family protein [Candidatus Margulisiibacteriota bacterium]
MADLNIKDKSIESSFLSSALATEGHFRDLAEFHAWFRSRSEANTFKVAAIPFSEMVDWHFDPVSGNLVHKSGRFFSIEGLRVKTNFGGPKQWEQPIINQPEIGILGIVTKKFGGLRYFLMQAKMEPGNVNVLQISPTVQATKSNYTQVHQGLRPLFLDYFLDRSKARVLVDQLQSEQGARFLRKRNRNMIVEIEDEIDLPEDFCWLTLGQLKELLKIDNLVNMDARSVLSGIRYAAEGERPAELAGLNGFAKDLLVSMSDRRGGRHARTEIISWFTGLKAKYECSAESVPLKELTAWRRTPTEISHESNNFFSVMAVSVQAGNREVRSWAQPLVKQAAVGLVGFLVKKIDNVLHVLVQAKLEPGFLDLVEMMPTVCFSDVECLTRQKTLPPFAEKFMAPAPERIRYAAILSEEGGRFYHSQNKYMVVEAAETEEFKLPENYIWMTVAQLLEFGRYNNYLSIETRSLLSCLNLL